MIVAILFFFFKQKTAYEMRISDWSSDVCSSDLPAPVARWETEVRDQGDPLLYMESIPYWETRGYVGTVLRNYWMYEAQQGKPSVSRAALAQGEWPRDRQSLG